MIFSLHILQVARAVFEASIVHFVTSGGGEGADELWDWD